MQISKRTNVKNEDPSSSTYGNFTSEAKKILRVPLKFAGVCFFLLVHGILCNMLRIVPARWGIHARLRVSRRMGRILLRILDIRVKVEGDVPNWDDIKTPTLLIGNHQSYLDILLFSGFSKTLFVTSNEVKESVALGPLTKGAGCIFVERRHYGKVLHDVNQIAAALSDGFHVTLFPEGTTGDGTDILPFKSSLLEATKRARCNVKSVCVEYIEIDGQPTSKENHHLPMWFDDTTFFGHLYRFMHCRSLTIKLTFLEPLPRSYRAGRKTLAQGLRDQLLENFTKIENS